MRLVVSNGTFSMIYVAGSWSCAPRAGCTSVGRITLHSGQNTDNTTYDLCPTCWSASTSSRVQIRKNHVSIFRFPLVVSSFLSIRLSVPLFQSFPQYEAWDGRLCLNKCWFESKADEQHDVQQRATASNEDNTTEHDTPRLQSSEAVQQSSSTAPDNEPHWKRSSLFQN